MSSKFRFLSVLMLVLTIGCGGDPAEDPMVLQAHVQSGLNGVITEFMFVSHRSKISGCPIGVFEQLPANCVEELQQLQANALIVSMDPNDNSIKRLNVGFFRSAEEIDAARTAIRRGPVTRSFVERGVKQSGGILEYTSTVGTRLTDAQWEAISSADRLINLSVFDGTRRIIKVRLPSGEEVVLDSF